MQFTIYNIQYTIYLIQYTIYNIPYPICNMQYTLYNMQYVCSKTFSTHVPEIIWTDPYGWIWLDYNLLSIFYHTFE